MSTAAFPDAAAADEPALAEPVVDDPSLPPADVEHPSHRRTARPTYREVPRQIRVAAEWSWRLLVIGLASLAVILLLARLKVPVLAVFVGLLMTALLYPLQRRLQSLGLRRGLATVLVMVGALTILIALGWFLTAEINGSVRDLGSTFSDGLTRIRTWLHQLGLSDHQLNGWVDQAVAALKKNQSGILSGALRGTTIAVEVISGALLSLFATIFFLYDGERIWQWVVAAFPRRVHDGVRESGVLAWATLTGYIRGTIVIAFVDAVSIGIALAVLRVPLALPLAVLVFFGAFIPIVGALLSGTFAVVVALAAKGPLTAVAVLAVILIVQQVEGHVLQPLVMGRMVQVHPLGIVLAVAAGTILAGIIGAIVAVPIVAVLTTVGGRYVRLSRAGPEGPD